MKEIYVGNLAYSITEEDLQSMFGEFGHVVNVKLITDRATGRSKGFGFVEYSTSEEANKAVEETNGKEFNGRPIKVNISRPKERTGSGGGGFGGGGAAGSRGRGGHSRQY